MKDYQMFSENGYLKMQWGMLVVTKCKKHL